MSRREPHREQQKVRESNRKNGSENDNPTGPGSSLWRNLYGPNVGGTTRNSARN